MKPPNWTDTDSRKCKQIWAEYQKQHDITDRIGQTAGIDPKSGRIWFGDSALEIVEKRETECLTSPLFFERVGYEAYFRKGRGKNEAFRHPRTCASMRGN
ncbi:MAG: hypothetical protein OXU36_02060 [Candidatus Poribacteria bacterium]|nr:hypothetical protein [Candidatus Poribacteria bacterium]